MRLYNFKNVKDAYQESRKYTKPAQIAEFPPYITFELKNNCNFTCVMCARTYMKSDKREMDLDYFKKCILEIAKYGSLIRLIGWEEPLLYSKIEEAIEFTKQNDLLIHITTNGSLLNDKMIAMITNHGVDSVIVSFQGLSKEEYMVMRNVKESMYETVMSNLQKLYLSKKNDKPFVKLTTTITERDDLSKKQEFIDTHTAYTDELQITGFTDLTAIDEHFGQTDIWNKLSLKKPTKKESVCCSIPNYEMKIRWDGTIFGCCAAFESDIKMNGKRDQSLLEIWESQQAAAIRKTVSSGQLDEFKDCKVCSIKHEYADIGDPITNTFTDQFESYSRILE
ncbi:MAG: radical SAM protein [Candidatus Lindowbacteria bacterium]|nr:radical SAM protein [Candidatus Lindowbacteria bacterium]